MNRSYRELIKRQINGLNFAVIWAQINIKNCQKEIPSKLINLPPLFFLKKKKRYLKNDPTQQRTLLGFFNGEKLILKIFSDRILLNAKLFSNITIFFFSHTVKYNLFGIKTGSTRDEGTMNYRYWIDPKSKTIRVG